MTWRGTFDIYNIVTEKWINKKMSPTTSLLFVSTRCLYKKQKNKNQTHLFYFWRIFESTKTTSGQKKHAHTHILLTTPPRGISNDVKPITVVKHICILQLHIIINANELSLNMRVHCAVLDRRNQCRVNLLQLLLLK